MNPLPPTLVVAGSYSGSGKTTVSLALMAALRRRGLTVQPYKCGPDFIDPGHHTAVCGRRSRNLDTWMLDDVTVRRLFARAAVGADLCIVEGVMGLFDGRSPDNPRGSTAHLARLLGAPVLLVVDARGMAASVAALVKGYAELDPALRIVAVLCNRVSGPRHYGYLEPPLRRHTAVEPVGWLPGVAAAELASRHLGLVHEPELAESGRSLDHDALAEALEATVDIGRLLELAARPDVASEPPPPPGTSRGRRIALARDAAFCFYYEDNLDLLRRCGAEIVDFSPLRDAALPEGTDLVWLGGGYPELHAARLAANGLMRLALRRHHRAGRPIYAECGGLMYACRELTDLEGRTWPMLDLLPARAVMGRRREALGYVTWRATAATHLGPAGTEVRGHEFHYSRLDPLGELHPSAELLRVGEPSRPDGYALGSLLAGYAHLHLASNPSAAAALAGNPGVSP